MTVSAPPTIAVKFRIVHPDSSPGEHGSEQDPSPYVQLSDPASSLECMQDRDEVVIRKERISVAVSYPLRQEYLFELQADDPAGFRRGELALKIAYLYDHIYSAEADTAPDPGSVAPGMLNRGFSDGAYGVYGHDLEDLLLCGVVYDAARDVYTLQVDS